MDLLFNEYASPFLLLDRIIPSGRLCDFIETFSEKHKERQRWEYYIHKLPPWDDTTWEQFCHNLDVEEGTVKVPTASKEQLETTINNTYEILQNFEPTERGEL